MGGCCSSCSGSQDVVLHGRRLRVQRLLGEGSFAFVYLVEDAADGRRYALKCIPSVDEESETRALREAEYHTFFDHPSLLRLHDFGVVRSVTPHTAEDDVAMLMPLHTSGTLHDLLVQMAEQGQPYSMFSESEALALFVSLCTGVRELHHHDPPYAHRDIKPANVLLTEDGSPVLMDFGSMRPARVHIESRQDALTLTDEAAENSTAPYRAPELFDVPSDAEIDARTDVWSLGCLLYAIAFFRSPFDVDENGGGSVAMAVTSGRVVFPAEVAGSEVPPFSQEFCDLVMFCLQREHTVRPTIDQVLDRSRDCLRAAMDREP